MTGRSQLMEYRKIDEKHFVVRLAIGEEIHDSLVALAEKENITFAMIQGIGAVREVTLGLYHLDRKEYRETKLYGIKEIISLTGTLDRLQEKPYGHFHIALGGEGGTTWGGHMVSGIIGITAEIVVTCFDTTLVRKRDESLGFNMWNLSQKA